MADTKITALTALTAADPANDVLPIVDVSDTTMAASGTTKKISVNNILGASGTATLASATITGDLTVDTNTLKVDSANNKVGIGTTTLASTLTIRGTLQTNADYNLQSYYKDNGSTWLGYHLFRDDGVNYLTVLSAQPWAVLVNGSERYRLASDGVATWSNVGGVAGTAMTLNATGLGVGTIPGASTGSSKIAVVGGATYDGNFDIIANFTNSTASAAKGVLLGYNNSTNNGIISAAYGSGTEGLTFWTHDGSSWGQRMELTATGNVGIGVTPSAWASNRRALQVGGLAAAALALNGTSNVSEMFFNSFINTSASNVYAVNGRAGLIDFGSGGFGFSIDSGTQTAGAACNFTRAMTLDASGNLLVGTTTSAGKFTLTQSANADSVSLTGNSGNFLRLYGWSVDNTWNANATAIFVGKQTSTSRSINAGGTVNASGADYAEYMTKAGDFVLSKGGIAGIDANGKLTNVFADAVSFVVKSTDPSYVGNDKWGIGLEGDALEAARQLVDRIAFAGQVPVNVTGAKAGDYIVPVVDGTGIKGIAVSNPTFEQYQLAVGKVIAIDADGRARIIVKVA